MSNDQNLLLPEQDKILHELMKEVWGANFISPIEQNLIKGKDCKVLDIGCSPSFLWILQLSKDYPLTKFIGFDKLSIFPKNFSQKNLQFVQGDILKGLPFENDSFDFIHMRFNLYAFTEEQWEETIIEELIRVCKPGGWIELLDVDDVKSSTPSSTRLINATLRHSEFNEVQNLILDDTLTELLKATNKVDTIHTDEKLIPIGNWGGDLGKLALEFFSVLFREVEFLEGSKEEHEIMVNQYIKEVEYYHSQAIFTKICSRKAIS